MILIKASMHYNLLWYKLKCSSIIKSVEILDYIYYNFVYVSEFNFDGAYSSLVTLFSKLS